MSAQDLWTDIFDGIQAVYFFLSGDLSRESLSSTSEQKRTKFAKTLEDLLNKIQANHPIQNSDTHSKPPPPPISETTPTNPEPPSIPDHEPTDYLAFEPSQLEGEEPQEVYEAMENEVDDQDVYEAPEGGDEPSELYEEPVPSRPSTSNGSLPGMTPPGSRENSGSGVEYMEANRSNVQLQGQQENGDISMEWSSVYQIPSAATKLKVGQLEGISIKGPLEKLGGKSHRTWQKRYCVLAGPLMYFYEKESSKTFNNFITVPSFSVELSENLSDKKHFAFKLTKQDHTGKKKDYCFRSTSSDNRDKWVTAMKKVIDVANGQKSRSAVTLPRLSSRPGETISPPIQEKRRSLSLGVQEEPQELYEPVEPGVGGEEDMQDDYVPVSPSDQIKEDFESSEEYIDVDPSARGDEPTEVYEEPPITLEEEAPPPPPTSPPPGPPKEHPFPPSSSPIPPPVAPAPVPPPAELPPKPQALPPKLIPMIGKKPAPPPLSEPKVNTSKVYVQSVNGISLEKVFVSLWDFAAGERDELNLKRGDLVLVKDPKENADWWFGELLDKEATNKLGKSGFFPRTYASHAFEAISS